ncbi:hypothetical protein C8J46_10518 [Sphingomonas sp. PP-F2F-A104-K0414]|uniref:hypothetical protein n=1 Tax=Sphingomonas sp. PP-F2F-A104-K0414 TaxID=2135661 RepID=UPI00104708EF|nr:hypothetical protein [Sphingomonas sp. PP-F2F-A104-K0414]TCP97874.1 hypothetical protein C8J46_10518 [Sphingomonas sp. PP-F2F-A104-K0414]
MYKFKLLLSTSLLVCMAAATPAMAQDGVPPAPPSTANPQDEAAFASASPAQAVPPSTPGQAPVDASALQDIIVTAESRFNTAQKTAAAITVRPSAEMLRQVRYELKNILEDVPRVVGGAAATVATSQGSGTGKNHFRQYWELQTRPRAGRNHLHPRGPHLVSERDDRGARYGVQRRPDHPDARRQVRHA